MDLSVRSEIRNDDKDSAQNKSYPSSVTKDIGRAISRSYSEIVAPSHMSYHPREVEAMVVGVHANKRAAMLPDQGFQPEKNFVRKVFPKSPDEYEFIKSAIQDFLLFTSLNATDLDNLIDAMELLSYNQGDYLIRQGEDGDYFYLVYDGRFDCFKNNTLTISYISGACFGELALLFNSKRGASVICSIPGHVWAVDRSTFRNTLMCSSQNTIEESRNLLRNIPLLKDLTDDQINTIANIVQIVVFEAGDMIIKKGDKGDIFYMIKEGSVVCTDAGTAGGEIELQGGDHFGERALILDEPRAANVIAKTHVVCFALVRDLFGENIGPLRSILENSCASYIIKSLPQLKALSADEKQIIVNRIDKRQLNKNEIIEKEGELMNNFIVVRDGKLKLLKNGQSDIKIINAGGSINEGIFGVPQPNQYTVQTLTPCELLVISRNTVNELIENKEIRSTILYEVPFVSPIAKSKFADFKISRVLGRGAFSVVHYSQHIATGVYYALKKLNKQKLVKHNQVTAIIAEKLLLSSLNHPFIQKIYATFQDSDNLYVVTQFLQGGDFFTRLMNIQGPVDNNSARFYSAIVLLGLCYLHDRNIVYRDLKPENIMIQKSGYLCLIDFGFAKVITSRSYTLCGTAEYLAPELVIGKGHNKAVDYWALGIFIYEMAVCQTPFYSMDGNPQTIFKKIIKGKYEYPTDYDDENAKNLINRLLTPDPSKRLGCLVNGTLEIKKHPFFDDIDWPVLEKEEVRPPWKPIFSKDPLKYFEPDDLRREPDEKYTGDNSEFVDF